MKIPSNKYLDAHELGDILKVSPATILRRSKSKPYMLPPPAHLGANFPLRWRRVDVVRWLVNLGLMASLAPYLSGPTAKKNSGAKAGVGTATTAHGGPGDAARIAALKNESASSASKLHIEYIGSGKRILAKVDVIVRRFCETIRCSA